jgi:hypothetical protein
MAQTIKEMKWNETFVARAVCLGVQVLVQVLVLA